MKEDIVIPAWEVASKSSGIKIFNFLPSLLATIYLSLILLYQVAWSYINIFNLKDEFFSIIIDFVHTEYFVQVVVGFVIFFLLYVLISPIAEGGVVSLIDAECRNADEREKTINFGM